MGFFNRKAKLPKPLTNQDILENPEIDGAVNRFHPLSSTQFFVSGVLKTPDPAIEGRMMLTEFGYTCSIQAERTKVPFKGVFERIVLDESKTLINNTGKAIYQRSFVDRSARAGGIGPSQGL